MKTKLCMLIFISILSVAIKNRFFEISVNNNHRPSNSVSKKLQAVETKLLDIDQLYHQIPTIKNIQKLTQNGSHFASHLKQVAKILTQIESKRKSNPALKSEFIHLYIRCSKNGLFSKTIRFYCMSKWQDLQAETFGTYLSSLNQSFKAGILNSIHFYHD